MSRFSQRLKKDFRDSEFTAGFLEADRELRQNLILSVFVSGKTEVAMSAALTKVITGVQTGENTEVSFNLPVMNAMPVWEPKVQVTEEFALSA